MKLSTLATRAQTLRHAITRQDKAIIHALRYRANNSDGDAGAATRELRALRAVLNDVFQLEPPAPSRPIPEVPEIPDLKDAIDIWIDSLIEDECKQQLQRQARTLFDYLSARRALAAPRIH